MICKVCGAEIERGKKYVGKTHTSIPFCSESCYNSYTKAIEQNSPRAMTDCFYALWEDMDFSLILHQAKSISKQYSLSYHDIGMIVKYGIVYENDMPNNDLDIGLYQYIPKYIQPCKKFIADIKKAKETEIPNSETNYVKPTVNKPYIKQSEMEFE